jgi:hypothetical protein
MSIEPTKHKWTCYHFSQSNPAGLKENDVPSLLRRVAQSIEDLGEIKIQDIVFGNEPRMDGGSDLHMTIYYNLPDLHIVDGSEM